MPRIGITGHCKVSPETLDLVRRALRDALSAYPGRDLTGLTCLAEGADQTFAQVVLDLGGQVEVILPAPDYREDVVSLDNRALFDALLLRAAAVRTLPFEKPGREAYMAASEEVVKSSERLLAVWDGQPADGLGGTADVVARARELGVAVEVIWPEGASR
jgi:hypothetical protein